MAWYVADLGDELIAGQALDAIEASFMLARPPTGWSDAAAVFVRRVTGDLHCNVRAYFSPDASILAAQFEARPSLPPPRENLTLLCGSQDAWKTLFK